MKFTIPTTTTTTRGVIIGRPDGTRVDCEQATPDEQRGALRAIAEHLGPEETIAALGTDAHAKQFADAQTREAIRAAGYDPDQVGAAEVIGDTVRSQLREWRETVGRALNQLALNADPKERVAAAVEILAPLTVSAIPDEQQGPVEPMVPAGERDRWRARAHDTIAGDTDFTGSIKGIANERGRLREKLKNSVNTVARAAGEIEALRDERDAALKRVEELEAELKEAHHEHPDAEHRCRYRADYVRIDAVFDKASDALTAAGAPAGTMLGRVRWAIRERDQLHKRVAELEQGRGMLIEGMAVVQARATRAETAVEAMRGVVEGAEGVAHCGPRTPDETWEPLQLRLVQAAILHGPAALAALADYDANKPEPTDERPQARAGDLIFRLDSEQKETAEEWMTLQRRKHPREHAASGGRFSYRFTPTSLGTVVKVFDTCTGAELDLSGYEEW